MLLYLHNQQSKKIPSFPFHCLTLFTSISDEPCWLQEAKCPFWVKVVVALLSFVQGGSVLLFCFVICCVFDLPLSTTVHCSSTAFYSTDKKLGLKFKAACEYFTSHFIKLHLDTFTGSFDTMKTKVVFKSSHNFLYFKLLSKALFHYSFSFLFWGHTLKCCRLNL